MISAYYTINPPSPEQGPHIWPSLDQIILHDKLAEHSAHMQRTHAQQHSQRPHRPIRVIAGRDCVVVVVVCATGIKHGGLRAGSTKEGTGSTRRRRRR